MNEFTIQPNNFFYTPTSKEDLFQRIQELSGQERTIAMTYAVMMMNLLAKELDEFKASQTAV